MSTNRLWNRGNLLFLALFVGAWLLVVLFAVYGVA